MKEQLRRLVLSQLASMDPATKEVATQRLTEGLLATSTYQKAATIATYLSLPHEFSTTVFIAQAQKDGKRILVPKTYSQGRMIMVDYDEEDVVQTKFGVLEPRSEQAVAKEMIDMIHVPGLAFNKEGYRIGYGGGYYDRYLADYRGKTVSTIFTCQRQFFEPASYDQAIQEVLVDED